MEELWSFKVDDSILGIELADINGNGQTEIIAYTKAGKLLIISLYGRLLFEDDVAEGSSIWCGRVHDIDNDGKLELILGGMDGLLRVFKCEGPSYELQPSWAHQFGSSISGVLIDDIKSDGIESVIAYSLDKSIRVINPLDGSLVWGNVFEDGIGDAMVWTDEKDPSKKEILVCGNDGTLRVFNGLNGELLWFKRFSNKMRCVSYVKSNDKTIITCGGDDKILHFIDKESQEEVKSMEFEDFTWKTVSFPRSNKENLLVSTYSYDYLYDDVLIDEIKFTSKLICVGENYKTIWDLEGVNIECLKIIEENENICVILGSTTGEIIALDGLTGAEQFKVKNQSCTNMIRCSLDKKLLISCHDSGEIFAYSLEM